MLVINHPLMFVNKHGPRLYSYYKHNINKRRLQKQLIIIIYLFIYLL